MLTDNQKRILAKFSLAIIASLCVIALAVAVVVIGRVDQLSVAMSNDMAWKEDTAKAINSLIVQVNDLKEQFEGSPMDISFVAEEYPISYTLTNEASEELREFLLNEQYPAIKRIYEISDEEYDALVNDTKEMDKEALLDSLNMGTAVLGIDILDENHIRIGGIESTYEVKDGVLYTDGMKFGPITEDVLSFDQTVRDVPLLVKFYREGKGEGAVLSAKEMLERMEVRIKSLATRIADQDHYFDHEDESINNLYDRVNEQSMKIEALESAKLELENKLALAEERLAVIEGRAADLDKLEERINTDELILLDYKAQIQDAFRMISVNPR